MCNLYSITKSRTAILEASRAMRDTTGNLPPLPGIFPDNPPRSCGMRLTVFGSYAWPMGRRKTVSAQRRRHSVLSERREGAGLPRHRELRVLKQYNNSDA
jgi:hypothetical protein